VCELESERKKANGRETKCTREQESVQARSGGVNLSLPEHVCV